MKCRRRGKGGGKEPGECLGLARDPPLRLDLTGAASWESNWGNWDVLEGPGLEGLSSIWHNYSFKAR